MVQHSINNVTGDEGQNSQFVSSDSDISDTDSDADMVGEGCGSPRMQRKRRLRKQKARMERRDSSTTARPLDDLLYDDNLPEVWRTCYGNYHDYFVMSCTL